MRKIRKYIAIILTVVLTATSMPFVNGTVAYAKNLSANDNQALNSDGSPSKPRKSGVIVKFKNKQNKSQADSHIKGRMKSKKSSFKDQDVKVDNVIGDIVTVNVQGDETVDSVIQALTGDPDIESVQPDYILQDLSFNSMSGQQTDNILQYLSLNNASENDTTTPSAVDVEPDPDNPEPSAEPDPDSPQPSAEPDQPEIPSKYTDEDCQWALDNHGQIIMGQQGIPGVDIGITSVTVDLSQFSEVIVGVLDTGVDASHASLLGKITAGYDFVNNDTSVFDQGDTYHGTEVASIIAGNGNFGMKGAAENVTIMPLKFIQDGYGYTSDALTAIQYAKDHGVKIINCSWGSTQYNPLLEEAMLENSDMLFLCAAGNDGSSQPVYPAAFDLANVISVGAIDNTGTLSSTSNYGANVDIAAPGKDIYTAAPGNTCDFVSGTSMATAYVTAAAGIYLGKDDLDVSSLKTAITTSATPTAALIGLVKSNGYLNIAKMLDSDLVTVVTPKTDSNDLSSEFTISDEVWAICNSGISYTGLQDNQKEMVRNTFFVRDDTMTECANAGFGITDSIRKAIIMQRFGITLQSALFMINNFGSEMAAYAQSGIFIKTQQEYMWYNSEEANTILPQFVVEGYPATNVIFSYIIAKAFDMNQQSIILKRAPSIGDIDAQLDRLGLSIPVGTETAQDPYPTVDPDAPDTTSPGAIGVEPADPSAQVNPDSQVTVSIETFKRIIRTYSVLPAAVADYIIGHGITVEEFYGILIDFEAENWLSVDLANKTLDDSGDGIEAPDTTVSKTQLNIDTGDDVSISDGSVDYSDHIATLPGRNGLDLDLTLKYKSSMANSQEAYTYIDQTNPVNNANKVRAITHQSPLDYMGNGWFFAFPVVIKSSYQSGLEYGSTIYGQQKLAVISNSLVYRDANGSSYEKLITDTPGSSHPIDIMNSDGTVTHNVYPDPYASCGPYGMLSLQSTVDFIFAVDNNKTYYVNSTYYSMYYVIHTDGKKEYYDAQGRLMCIADRFGNMIKFDYSADGTTVNITDSVGQITKVERNGATTTVTLPDEKPVTYNIANAQLKTKTDQLGRITTYEYEDGVCNVSYQGQVYHKQPSYSDGSFNFNGYEYKLEYISYTTKPHIKVYWRMPPLYSDQCVYDGDWPIDGIIPEVTLPDGTSSIVNGIITEITPCTVIKNLQLPTAQESWVLPVIIGYTLLKSVVYYTGAKTDFSYLQDIVSKGCNESPQFRVSSRKDTVDGKICNELDYSYNGDTQSYPGEEPLYKVTISNPADGLVKAYTFGVAGIGTITVKQNGTTISVDTYYYNHIKIDISTGVYSTFAVTGGDAKLSPTVCKDDIHTLMKIVSQKYKAGVAAQRTDEHFSYDLYGNLLGHWDKQAGSGASDTVYPTSSEHKTTYNYGSSLTPATVGNGNYSIPLSETYKTDANTTVTITNTLSTAANGPASTIGKAIGKTKVTQTRNSVTTTLQETDYTYDAYGNVLTKKEYIGDGRSRDTTYTYQNGVFVASESVKLSDASAVETSASYTYDIYGHVLTSTDGKGSQSTYSYDAGGRLLSKTGPAGTATTAYDNAAKTITSTNELGDVVKTTCNQLGYPTKVEDVTPGMTAYTMKTYEYDNLMRLHIETDGMGTPTTYEYDYLDRVISKSVGTNGSLYKETYTYDDAITAATSKITKTVVGEVNAPDVKTVAYTNLYGFVTQSGYVSAAKEYLNTFTYDYMGNKVTSTTPAVTDAPNGYTTNYAYDGLNHLLKTTNPDGNAYQTAYDELGQKISTTDPKGYAAAYQYNAMGLVTQETLPFDGNYTTITKNTYDKNGNLTSKQQTNNKPGAAQTWSKTEYAYDNRNFMTRVTSYNGSAVDSYVDYEYDAAGNVTKMKTANGTLTTQYEYDKRGRLTKLTDPMLYTETYDAYDNNGNLKQKTDRSRLIITTYTYDLLNRVTNVKAGTDPDVKTSYYKTGAVLSTENGNLKATYSYDDAGRLVKELDSDGTQKQYTYDAFNNRSSFLLYQGSGTTLKLNETYAYDSMNRLKEVKSSQTATAGAATVSYTYDQNGNRLSMTYQNGVATTYNYNKANLVTSLTNKNSAGAVLSSYAYTYYLDGNQETKTDNLGSVTAYTYDGLGRLSKETDNQGTAAQVNMAYTYDTAGNRHTMTVSGLDSYTTTYTYDNNNRLTKETRTSGTLGVVIDSTSYTYDQNGNQTGKTGPNVSEIDTYDKLNRLVTVTNGTATATYKYNADGLRIAKTTTTGGVAQTVNSIWDGSNIVMETNGSGAVTDIYLRGINLLAWINQTTGVTEYYSYNAHGDVTQLTDATGKVVKEYRYDAFGNEITSDAASGVVTTGTFGYFSNGAQKVSMKAPGSTVSAETLVIPPGSNVGANTPNMTLERNTNYILEFDYWSDNDGEIIITDLYPDTLPENYVKTEKAKTLYSEAYIINSSLADMSSCTLRFFINGGYGHVNTGNVYVTNIRFYKQGAAQTQYMYKGQYFDAGSGLDTTYFTAFWNAASNTIKAVPGQTGTTNVLTLKGSLTACALTAPMVLSLNTDYVVEFDYWSDGDGNTLKTDLYSSVTLASVTPQMSLPATTAGVVQHGTVMFNSANVNMASAELRFFYSGSNTYNVYVANVRFYNKAVYTSGQFLDINSAVKTNAFVNFWIYATNTVMTPPWTTVSMNVLTIKPATASTAFTAQMNLKTNTTYVVEFDYWSAGTTANEQIVTDLYSSVWGNSLTTQVHSAATTKLKHMKLTFTSTNSNMNTAQLRFFYSGGSTADVYVANVLFYEDGTAGIVGADGNKFRYCGMYWDGETGTYYDLARYYNPAIGRFTQEDSHWNPGNMIYGDNPTKLREYKDALGLNVYTYAPDNLAIRQSNNLYVYCMNNPVYYVDENGNFVWPGQIHQAVMYNIMYGSPYGAMYASMSVLMGGPSPCGRYLDYEIAIRYIQETKDRMGTNSGRADLVDTTTGEFWEIKSNQNGTGYADASFDVIGYAIKGNYYQGPNAYFAGVSGMQPIPGGNIPYGVFDYSVSPFEHYMVSYWYAGPGIILYSYYQYTNDEDQALAYLAALLAILAALSGAPAGALAY